MERVENTKFNEYLQVARFVDTDSQVFKEIFEGIMNLVSEYYSQNFDNQIAKIQPFASIVGPSFMGKTQFAFVLARVYPVFYVNFASKNFPQEVYEAFDGISQNIKTVILEDFVILNAAGIGLESDQLASSLILKLRTIGFIWELILYSLEFDAFGENESDSDWMKFYLEPRTISYKSMNILEYLGKLSNL